MTPAKNSANKPEPVEPPKNTSKAEPQETAPAVPEQASHHDDTDVEAALARTTADGKGEDPVPPSDFQSFATEGVEKKSNLLSVAEVVDQVLAGHWGSTAATASSRLEAAGYDVHAVTTEFERRKQAGAPSAF